MHININNFIVKGQKNYYYLYNLKTKNKISNLFENITKIGLLNNDSNFTILTIDDRNYLYVYNKELDLLEFKLYLKNYSMYGLTNSKFLHNSLDNTYYFLNNMTLKAEKTDLFDFLYKEIFSKITKNKNATNIRDALRLLFFGYNLAYIKEAESLLKDRKLLVRSLLNNNIDDFLKSIHKNYKIENTNEIYKNFIIFIKKLYRSDISLHKVIGFEDILEIPEISDLYLSLLRNIDINKLNKGRLI